MDTPGRPSRYQLKMASPSQPSTSPARSAKSLLLPALSLPSSSSMVLAMTLLHGSGLTGKVILYLSRYTMLASMYGSVTTVVPSTVRCTRLCLRTNMSSGNTVGLKWASMMPRLRLARSKSLQDSQRSSISATLKVQLKCSTASQNTRKSFMRTVCTSSLPSLLAFVSKPPKSANGRSLSSDTRVLVSTSRAANTSQRTSRRSALTSPGTADSPSIGSSCSHLLSSLPFTTVSALSRVASKSTLLPTSKATLRPI